MKREVLKDGPNIPVKIAPVPSFKLAWPIYEVLAAFYERHERRGLPECDSLKSFVLEATLPGDTPPILRKEMKMTIQEERDYATRMLKFYEDLKVDEANRLVQRKQKFNSDAQILIDLVEQVLETVGSRIDWDKHPELGDNDEEHRYDDVTEFPEA